MVAHLSDSDIERCRYHLGYMETSEAASIQLGIPKPAQTLFLFEQAVQLVMPVAVPRVLRILGVLDKIEEAMVEAVDFLIAGKLGDLELRGSEKGQTHPDLLEREYARWAARLADVLGCPFYPFSHRTKLQRGVGTAGNLRTSG